MPGLRIVKNLTLDYDDTIKAYEDKFKEFKSDFKTHGVLITEVTVLQTKFLIQQVKKGVENIGEILYILQG